MTTANATRPARSQDSAIRTVLKKYWGYDELRPLQLEAIEGLTRGIIGKLLHDPSVVLKDAAGSPRGERLVASLRELFVLDDDSAPPQ